MDDETRTAAKLVIQALAQIARELRLSRERSESQDRARAAFHMEQRQALERLRPAR